MTVDLTGKRQWLSDLTKRAAQEQAAARGREVAWGWARLLTFLAAGLAVYAFWSTRSVALTAAGVLLVTFYYCVRRHLSARAARELADNLLLVSAETQRRLGGALEVIRSGDRPADVHDPAASDEPFFPDAHFHPLTDQERGDLDLYTLPLGLFGLLNRTSSVPGARRLRDLLENPALDADEIAARQVAVQWLDAHAEARLRMMAGSAGLRKRGGETDRFAAAVQTAAPLWTPIRVNALRIWGVAALLFLVLAVCFAAVGRYGPSVILVPLAVGNFLLLLNMRREVQAALAPWSALLLAAQECHTAARIAAGQLPDVARLGELRRAVRAVVFPPVLERLGRRLAWTDSGGFIHTVLNVIAFWDLQLAASILHVALPHRDELLRALSALAELDALSSPAAFAWEQPQVCYPQLAATGGLQISGGVHPLLATERGVPNDLSLTPAQRTWIVTGSNMAGKSTFLRMIGVNVLLAQAGTVAAARAMTWQPMRLITDLRAADSLGDAESYFLSEVRHIRRMVLPPADSALCLGLIDEPFRGTNSQEQVAASLAVAEHLIASPHYFLVATHDQRLTELADDVCARNVHFREHLESTGMVFDYLLRPGPAQTRNALRVLELEGYPAALLERARMWLREDSKPS